MIQILIYIILALFATTIGSISGMGGGVIMKPVMDFLGNYTAKDIGVLSSITVFSMSIVSLLKSLPTIKKNEFSILNIILLGFGSVLGGFIGQYGFALLENAVKNNALVTIVQNVVLLLIIGIVFIYMIISEKVKNFSFSNCHVFAVTGIFLGCMSSFLGIGGGPINVAILMFLFSFPIKTATFISIITILFAQISKLGTVLFTTGFFAYDLTMAPWMIVSAILGGFIGSIIKKSVSSKTVAILFNVVQVMIMIICISNIIKSVN